MTTYTLDTSKWRCGGSVPSLGKGDTFLLNHEGYMCCLGQFSLPYVSDEESLRILADPKDAANDLDCGYHEAFVTEGWRKGATCSWVNTELAAELMAVNDCPVTTPAEKVEQIRVLLAQEGHELVVVDEQNLLGDES